MKAVVWTRYGPPEEVLKLQDVEKPKPGKGEVLVKVHAASINSWDWELLEARFTNTRGGKRKVPKRVLGCDISGVVEEVGSGVAIYKKGDKVFGDISRDGWGGFAEYASARADMLSRLLKDMSFEDAAAIPQAAVLALQALRKGRLRKGLSVLINGAGGGVGSFAIQMAKSMGAKVVGIDRADKMDFILSMGADEAIDYSKVDFTESGKQYDLILDVIGHHSIFQYKKVLNPNGRCIMVGGTGRTAMPAIFFGSWLLGNRKVQLLLHKPLVSDLEEIKKSIVDGRVKPVVDKVFPLEKTYEAFNYYCQGRVKGKVVITM